MDEKNKTLTRCQNCGEEPIGNFCPQCGQKNRDYHLSAGQFITDFFGDYFTLDSKFFRSIVPLIIKPGFLTNEYVAGRRIRFIPPLRLYIFISVIFFFLLSTSPHSTKIVQFSDDPAIETAINQPNFTELITQPPLSRSDKPEPAKIEPDTGSTGGQEKSIFSSLLGRKLSRAKQDQTGFSLELLNNFPRMMFFMLPVFALLLKLFYIRSNRFYVEYLIFSLHFHSFLFLGFVLISLIFNFYDQLLPEIAAPYFKFLLIICGIYLFLALKKVYRQSYFNTFLKLGLLTISYIVAFSISMLGALLVSLWLF